MNLRKISGAVLTCILAGTLFTGCGGNSPDTSDSPDTRIGVIAKLNASEEALNDHLKNLEKAVNRPNMNLTHHYFYYEGMNGLVMAMNADALDEISTYRSVANYLVARDPKFEILNHTVNMYDSFCCAVRADDKALLENLNSAIEGMKTDGTLDKLVKTYITEVKADEDPPAVRIRRIAGGQTLKVGITGDLPPLDLVLADGRPAGFNTAMIAEISKRLGKNIDIVPISSTARAAALQSKKIDIVFWVTQPGEFWYAGEVGTAPVDIDKTSAMAVTAPYFEDEIVHVGLKDN